MGLTGTTTPGQSGSGSNGNEKGTIYYPKLQGTGASRTDAV